MLFYIMSLSFKTIMCIALFDIWELNLRSQGTLNPSIAIEYDVWSFYFCIYKMELKVKVF